MSKKYKHKVAYSLLTYCCSDCGKKDMIWNSRDGLAPTLVACSRCKKHSKISKFSSTKHRPYYKPITGMRIIADQTEEEFRKNVAEMVDVFWNDPSYTGIKTKYGTKQNMISMVDFTPGQPSLEMVK